MNDTNPAHPTIASREHWLAARQQLLQEEKAVTRAHDAVNARRRRLPMVRLDKTYTFDSPNGSRSLTELFDGRRQLIVYHFMFDPAWENGCTGCTGFVDALGDLSMLAERQTTMVLISRAPLAKLDAYKARRGWTLPWLSSSGSDFNYDFHASLDESVAPPIQNYRELPPGSRGGEMPGISVFFRTDNAVFHTYSTFARGVELCTDAYPLLDLTPYGRQEDWEDSPDGWPQKPTYG